MATFAAELPETYASITRPVAFDVVKQLTDRLNIDPNEVNIVIPGANGKLSVWNADNIDRQESVNLTTKTRIYVTIKEDYVEDDLLTMVSKRDHYPPIFHDKGTKIKVAPIYSRTKVTISLAFRTVDRYTAESFRDNWRRRIAELREYMVFNAKYTYPIPETIRGVLQLLHRTRKVNTDDYPNFEDYLKAFGLPQLTYLTNSAGNGDVWACREVQENIYGNFTDPTPAEVEKDDNGSAWMVSFDFEYYYDKPISVWVEYPICVNNELVDEILYPEQPFDITTLKYRSTISREYYHEIQNMMGYYWQEDSAYIRIPEFDDWTPGRTRVGYISLLSALLLADEEDPRYICNLTDLGDWALNERLVDIFKENARWVTKHNEFPFLIRLHVDDYPVDNELILDEELNLIAKYPLLKFKTQHITIDYIHDISKLTTEGRKRFFSNPTLVNLWFDLTLGHQPIGGYPRVNGDRYVDIRHFEELCQINEIYPNSHIDFINPGRLLATVGIFTVSTHNTEE